MGRNAIAASSRLHELHVTKLHDKHFRVGSDLPHKIAASFVRIGESLASFNYM